MISLLINKNYILCLKTSFLDSNSDVVVGGRYRKETFNVG